MIISLILAVALGGDINPRIDRYLTGKVKDGESLGISVAVVRDQRVVYLGSVGLANITTSRKADPDTCFRTMSVGKQFTAAGLLLLPHQRNRGRSLALSLALWRTLLRSSSIPLEIR